MEMRFCCARKTSSNIEEYREVQRRRNSEIEGRTFSKDDENGALRELESICHSERFQKGTDTILSRFRSNKFFNFVTLKIDDSDQSAISILLRIEESKSCLKAASSKIKKY